MHAFSRWLALATVLSGAAAYADQNDLQVSKLGRPSDPADPSCTSGCPTGNSQFQSFARAFAASLTSVTLTPPKTTGHAGFNVNGELSVVNLPGTVVIPTTGTQPSTMLVPSLHVRKGLPFSVELGGRIGWVEKSRMVAATGEVKWAINEGSTLASHHRSDKGAQPGAPGGKPPPPPDEESPVNEQETGFDTFMRLLPDLSVRGHVTRLMGVADFDLTDAGVDLGVGKQFPVGGMVTFTPYGGLDFNFVGANTGRYYFPPEGSAQPPSDSLTLLKDNTAAYQRMKVSDNMTQRIYGGVRFIGGALQLGAEVSFTRLGTVKLDPTSESSDSRTLPTVVTFNTSIGLDF